MAYRISKEWTSSLAYGTFFQNPESRFFTEKIINPIIKELTIIFSSSKSSRWKKFEIGNVLQKISRFNKTTTDFYRPIAVNNNGSGYAKGVELFWRDKKSLKNIDYWVSYSYLDSKEIT